MVDDEKKGATLIRTIVNLSTVLTASGSGGKFSMGLVMVNDDANASLAFPDPGSAGDDAGWLWRTERPIATSDSNDASQWIMTNLDLRGRRKFPGEEFDIHLLIAAGTLTANINTDGWIRMLFMRA